MDSSYYSTTTTASADPAAVAGMFGFIMLLMLVFAIPLIIGLWKTFVKAGKPGWAAIVPFYNMYVLTVEIAQKPIWWFILLFVPYVNIVMNIMIVLEIAKKFGKSVVFAIFGLILFPYVGWLMLGFGSAQYQGGTPTSPTPPTTPPTPNGSTPTPAQ